LPGKVRVGRAADLGDRTFFFEIIPDLLVICGYDGYMRDVNTAWQNSVGWSRKELQAIPFLEFIHPEDRARMASEMTSVQKGIFMMFLESRFQCKDGTYKWLMWKAAGMPGRSKVYMLGREIVQGKDGTMRPGHSDKGLERKAAQLDLTQEWLGAGSWELDLASMRLWASDGLARILDLTPPEFPQTADDALTMIPTEDHAAILEAMRRAVESGTSEIACRVTRRDGTLVPVRGLVRSTRDRDGVAQTISGVVVPDMAGSSLGLAAPRPGATK